jgi:hypothetical protein
MNVPSIVDNASHGSIQEKRKSRARNLQMPVLCHEV